MSMCMWKRVTTFETFLKEYTDGFNTDVAMKVLELTNQGLNSFMRKKYGVFQDTVEHIADAPIGSPARAALFKSLNVAHKQLQDTLCL